MCLPGTRCPKSNQSFASAVAQLIKDKAGKRETNPGLDQKAKPRRANIFFAAGSFKAQDSRSDRSTVAIGSLANQPETHTSREADRMLARFSRRHRGISHRYRSPDRA